MDDSVDKIEDPAMSEMMKYVVKGDGGMLRPQLVIRTGEVYGVPRNSLIAPATAQEFVHRATLILDDAPQMDNSEKRNGRTAFHVKYGPDNTILVAQYITASLALELNAKNDHLSYEQRSAIHEEAARAASGLCIGQRKDLKQVPESLDEMVELHKQKTGDLFAASVVIGGIAGNAKPNEIKTLRTFGHNLGIAYQIGDDLYDRFGDPEVGGKPVGQDGDKVTVFEFMDEESAVKYWKNFYRKAGNNLKSLSKQLSKREEEGDFVGQSDVRSLEGIMEAIYEKQVKVIGSKAA